MRLILHIGSTKTGSSALQATLNARRDQLAEAGALYSAHGVAAGAHHLLAASIHPGAWQMHKDELPSDRAAYFDETVAAIKAEAEEKGADTIVVSSEYFWGSLPPTVYKAFADAFRPARFEVVAFIRRQDEWAMSSYLQAVKNGEARPFEEWFEKTLQRTNSGLHYFRVINRWAYFLDAEAVHVLRYGDVKENVYAAFCDTLGINVETNIPLARVNPSPTADGLALLLEINRSDADEAEKAKQRKQVMGAHRASGSMSLLMTDTERDTIFKEAEVSDRLIATRFLKQDGPLFSHAVTAASSLPPEPSPEPAEPPSP
nr:hypothetical protein [Acuticoccus kalidii]